MYANSDWQIFENDNENFIFVNMQTRFGITIIPCYWIAFNNNCSIPLKGITVKSTICNLFADVSSKYTYENESPELLESSFVFPIEYGATVYRFEVEIGNEKFIGTCRERHEVGLDYNFKLFKALCVYEEAKESNRHAFILLEDEEMLDTFSMKIGNIPPNERVYVTISYFQKLNSIFNHVDSNGHNDIIGIFSMPFLLNSRYAPKSFFVLFFILLFSS